MPWFPICSKINNICHISSLYPLPFAKERVVKFKDYLMFRPKNRQTLLRISTLNKFLHVFYNHKYYSFYI